MMITYEALLPYCNIKYAYHVVEDVIEKGIENKNGFIHLDRAIQAYEDLLNSDSRVQVQVSCMKKLNILNKELDEYK